MTSELDPQKFKVLLCFLEMGQGEPTVTNLARIFGTDKSSISRIIQKLKNAGMLDNANPRNIKLTDYGRECGEKYKRRLDIALEFFLTSKVPDDDAKNDAMIMALYASDNAIALLQNKGERNRLKELFENKKSFDGETLCRALKDGRYPVPFVVYREKLQSGYNISMANDGLEHPCELRVHNGVGIVYLKTVSKQLMSNISGERMTGKLERLKYFDGASFSAAGREGDYFFFPASCISFLNIGNEQILLGSISLKFSSSVGDRYMPESVAVFTMFFS